MLNDLLIWVALLIGLVLLIVDKRRKIGALTLAYFLTLSLGHVPGALAYLDTDSSLLFAEPTKIGFDATLIGLTAFVLGAGAARLLRGRTANLEAYRQAARGIPFARVGWRVLMMGVVTYFLVLPMAVLLPSFTAIASVTGLLLIVGFWLRLYVADGWQTLLTLATTILLPLSTLVTGGFIGFGTVWALSIVTFCFVISRRRIWYYLGAPLVIFLGLSLFVTYFQQREDIRNTVWNQDTTFMDRVNKVSTLVTDFQFLDLSNELHRWALDERLNQNYLVGIGVARHRDYGTALMYGATVPVWALIPRAIWPDKPSVGGGGDLVSKFTGIAFAEGTSVGAGQVLEFYMNFGMPGVVVGFAIFGFVLMLLDQQIMRALTMGRIGHMVKGALPGLALVAPLGNLVEILVAGLSAVIVSRLIIYFNLLGLPRTQRPSAKIAGRTMQAVARR